MAARKYRVKRLAQSQVASANMGVELVFSIAVFVERAKQPAVVLVEGSSVNVARDYRRFHMGTNLRALGAGGSPECCQSAR